MFNPESASRCYEASLKLNPKSAQVMNNLGTIYDSEKEYNNAERMYRKALKLDPKSGVDLQESGDQSAVAAQVQEGLGSLRRRWNWIEHFQEQHSPRVQNPASSEGARGHDYYMAKGCVVLE